MNRKSIIYRPILFICFTFCLTWACVCFLEYQIWLDYSTFMGKSILMLIDFLKSAAPLLAALCLFRKQLLNKHFLIKFIFGEKPKILPYLIVVFLFVYQFLTFYFFRIQESISISLLTFVGVWVSQIVFGGGMEEGGWRGYLQPEFEKRVPAFVSVLGVGLVWSCWHIPYFFLPNTFQTGTDFLFYVVTATATAFTLTTIYKLTHSVLVCTLFHGWQNAIVMNFTADMGNSGFWIMFGLQTVVSIILCIKITNNLDNSKS